MAQSVKERAAQKAELINRMQSLEGKIGEYQQFAKTEAAKRQGVIAGFLEKEKHEESALAQVESQIDEAKKVESARKAVL